MLHVYLIYTKLDERKSFTNRIIYYFLHSNNAITKNAMDELFKNYFLHSNNDILVVIYIYISIHILYTFHTHVFRYYCITSLFDFVLF